MRSWRLSIAGACGSLLFLLGPSSSGQEKPKQPAPRQFIVWVDAGQFVQAISRKSLRAVQDADGKDIITYKLSEKDRTFSFEIAPEEKDFPADVYPMREDPSTVRIWGNSPGTRRIVLIDKDGTKEACDILVRRMVFVPIGASQLVQLTSQMPVKKIENAGDKTIRVEAVAGDKLQVKVTGLTAGDTRINLSAYDGKTETVEVVVRSTRGRIVETVAIPGARAGSTGTGWAMQCS